MSKIANVALTNTFDTWRIRTNQVFHRINQFAINESSLYANSVTANVRFTSLGFTKLGDSTSDSTIVNGTLTANTILNVTGNTTVVGVIRSTTGGFKYPDGATTTAPLYVYNSAGTQVYP
jgi:hypothetical protein